MPVPPKSFEEVLARMDAANKAMQHCKDNGLPMPKSLYTMEQKQEIIDKGEVNEKYIVRIVESKYVSDDGKLGLANKETNQASYWTTTYTQIEHADSNAKMIWDIVGWEAKEGAEYSLFIIDKDKAYERGGMLNVLPTYESLSDILKTEIPQQFKGEEHLIDEAMTPETSAKYTKIFDYGKSIGLESWEIKEQQNFIGLCGKLNVTGDKLKLMKVRNDIHNLVGANEEFLGTGLTKGLNGQDGVVETFTYDRNPDTIKNLSSGDPPVIKVVNLGKAEKYD